ncbi:uncharacterized protein LOC111065830 [Drosophila obscura]|uniref:uncharacterized protein LOC111065830 n=1 Tax=Drosophila obscura TaxID=7282 RepID=UPI001BB19CA3|nr:uncharacterized protein LOC111065830 [Drosophila obscura]
MRVAIRLFLAVELRGKYAFTSGCHITRLAVHPRWTWRSSISGATCVDEFEIRSKGLGFIFKTFPAADIEKCRFGDSPCLVRTINDLIKRHPKGIPEIGLPPLDEYNFPDSTVLDAPQRGPIWMTFHMRHNVHRGFNNATVSHVEGFQRDPTKKQIILKARLPRLVHDATYDMQGRILLFVANTTGKLQSDFQNFRLTLTIKVILEYRNNKRYLKIYDMVPIIDIDRWIVWFDNLYGENEDVTIALNHSFNKHWLEFWNNLEPGILKTFSTAFTVLLNTVFEQVAYDDMFLPDIDIRFGSSDAQN